MNLVSCTTFYAELADKQDKLLGCDGKDLPANSRIPTCDEVKKAEELANGNWSIKPTPNGELGFYCNNVLVASLDCSGNFTALGDISGFCTP